MKLRHFSKKPTKYVDFITTRIGNKKKKGEEEGMSYFKNLEKLIAHCDRGQLQKKYKGKLENLDDYNDFQFWDTL